LNFLLNWSLAAVQVSTSYGSSSRYLQAQFGAAVTVKRLTNFIENKKLSRNPYVHVSGKARLNGVKLKKLKISMPLESSSISGLFALGSDYYLHLSLHSAHDRVQFCPIECGLKCQNGEFSCKASKNYPV
jgi:hypothetical protein